MFLSDITDPLSRQGSYSPVDGRIEWSNAMAKELTLSAWIKHIGNHKI